MKRLLFLIILIKISIFTLAQSCLPEGIYFVIQQDVDEFKSKYPNCTEIEGFVEIHGSMWDLSGLDGVTRINGNLRVIDCDVLEDLAGFESIVFVGGKMEIFECNELNSLSGLGNLESIGGDMEIRQNYNLTSLYGLTSLVTIGGQMEIKANSSLKSFGEFTSLSTIGGNLAIVNNSDLIDLSGLTNLNSINGILQIASNKNLSSLTGLDYITHNSISQILISNNYALSTCEVKSVCDYIFNETGFLTIYGNASGCNSQDEIEEACVSAIDEIPSITDHTVYPNPFPISTTIEYMLSHPQTVTIIFHNQFGKQVDLIQQHQQSGEQQITWNPLGLPPGMYHFSLQAGDQVTTVKLELMK